MAIKKTKVKKKTAKKAVVKKKAVKKKAVKKKAAVKKKPKSTGRKKPARGKAKKHTKPKLGFDPLSHDDIAALTSPEGTVAPAEDENIHTGIDALIRDTSREHPAPVKQEPEKVSPEPPVSMQEVSEPEVKEAPTADVEKPEAREEKAAPSEAVPKALVDEERGDLSTFFSFSLGTESFAIAIERVREVLGYQNPTKVPKTLDHMIGVINLRGSVVPVVDLRLLLGMPEARRTVDSAIIIVEVETSGEQAVIGVLVDGVQEVMDISDSDVAPPPKLGTGLKTDYLKGMGKHGGEFIMILDIDNALSVEGLV